MRKTLIMMGMFVALLTGCTVDTSLEETNVPVEPIEEVEIVEAAEPVEPVETVAPVEAVDEPLEAVETTAVKEAEATAPSLWKITAYCACGKCCGEYADGITATGTVATEGRTIAVDPNVIPYGSRVLINGHEYVAEDCGGSIRGNRIDMFFDSHEAALEWGIKYLEVEILD